MIKFTGINNVPNFEDYKSVSSSQYTLRDEEYTKILTNYKKINNDFIGQDLS